MTDKTLEKSDLQIVLEEVKKVYEKVEAMPKAIAEIVPKSEHNVPKDNIPQASAPLTIEAMKALLESFAKPKGLGEGAPIEKTVYKFSKPVEADFASNEAFQKALKEYEDFKKSIVDEAKQSLGNVIQKSVPSNEPAKDRIDIGKLFKDIGETDTLGELLQKEGVA